MPKEENIVSFTLEQIKARLAANKPDLAAFHALTDEEIERNAASDVDDPTNHPDFWKKSELVYPKDALSKIQISIDRDLYDFMQQHHWNIQSSVNAALREYMRNHRD